MTREFKVIILLCAAFIVSNMWTMLPETEDYIKPFYFSPDLEINKRTHWFFIFGRIRELMLISGFSLLINRYKAFFGILFWLTFLDVIDYCIIYCEPIVYVNDYPVEFSLMKGILMIFTGIWIYFFKEIKYPST